MEALELLDRLRRDGDVEAFLAFLESYPEGAHVDDAERALGHDKPLLEVVPGVVLEHLVER